MLRAEVHVDPRHRRKGDDPTAADAESQRASLLRAQYHQQAQAHSGGARWPPLHRHLMTSRSPVPASLLPRKRLIVAQ
jgi:hypothetical protein